MQTLTSYVLITAARNEAKSIEATIKSVLAQTARPLRWVIVSDGSTDGTDEIVKSYAGLHEWIEFIRLPERSERDFAGKAFAFKAGEARVADLPYEVIANLDADISFRSDYFSFLLDKLDTYPDLGVAGTSYVETSGESYDLRFTSVADVFGACQVFRRECFEAIGGYMPLKFDAIDCIAVVRARMEGWEARIFSERVCMRHRGFGTAGQSVWQAGVRTGAMDYALGNHPLWQVFRALYQATHKPILMRGIAVELGYVSAAVKRIPRPVARDFIRFHRREQMWRLKKTFKFWGSSGRGHMISHGGIREAR